ncbi:MAG: WbqC family protein [Planctomycetes bacterium]|nr:WbqC family protein [Planctomycetota bacterium]
MTTVAIHQPNFFPWLGFFSKLARADVFLLLDDVQQPRTGRGGWGNRVRLRFNGEARWWSAPLARGGGVIAVNEQRFADTRWRRKALTSLQMCYGKATHFQAVFPGIQLLIESEEELIAEFNERAIATIASWLGLSTELRRTSTLGIETVGTERLVQLVQGCGGTTYLCGDGSEGYLEEERFQQAGIQLEMMDYQHPTYHQGGAPFLAGLSILDSLFHCGLEQTRALVMADGPPPTVPMQVRHPSSKPRGLEEGGGMRKTRPRAPKG